MPIANSDYLLVSCMIEDFYMIKKMLNFIFSHHWVKCLSFSESEKHQRPINEDPLADSDFSDIALKYLSQILMEEDLEEKTGMFKESLALEATEKLFHDIIGEIYPPPGEENCGNPSENDSIDFSTYGFVDVPMSTLKVPNIFNDRESVLQFRRGFEEASKFLPNRSDLSVDSANHNTELLVPNNVMNKVEKKHGGEHFTDGSRGKKKTHRDLECEEVKSNKQSAVYNEMTLTSEMFDRVLLCDADAYEAALRESFQNETSKTLQQDGQSKGSNAGKPRGWKKGGKKDLVDLRSLLALCAQAVADDDQVSAGKQLQQIRQHASPMGDGMQRLAHYFANALEARLDGSGSQICKAVITKPSGAHFLKKAERLHIIDFGVLYGFSWPSLLQRLSTRPGGPPKLRITGIDFPEPGFRPAQRGPERIERPETYKQWQIRNERAGFRQLPLDQEIVNIAKEREIKNRTKSVDSGHLGGQDFLLLRLILNCQNLLFLLCVCRWSSIIYNSSPPVSDLIARTTCRLSRFQGSGIVVVTFGT
ncbi:unnamed protein product, partial [Vitis vinifera]